MLVESEDQHVATKKTDDFIRGTGIHPNKWEYVSLEIARK